MTEMKQLNFNKKELALDHMICLYKQHFQVWVKAKEKYKVYIIFNEFSLYSEIENISELILNTALLNVVL